jgi:hypothetical protein
MNDNTQEVLFSKVEQVNISFLSLDRDTQPRAEIWRRLIKHFYLKFKTKYFIRYYHKYFLKFMESVFACRNIHYCSRQSVIT